MKVIMYRNILSIEINISENENSNININGNMYQCRNGIISLNENINDGS
jgi:hypothetical protein